MAEAAQSGDLRIAVVIPHLNQPQMLARCLASLGAGKRRPDAVYVVDNGSANLPEAVCAAAGLPVTLLGEPTPGPGPARNRGVAAALGEGAPDLFAFIDADCLADPDWLAAVETEFAKAGTEILGGDVRIAYADPARLTALEAYESIYAYRMDRYIAREGFTGTGNLAVHADVMAKVGPFAGLGVAEDRDWGQRATRAGHALRYVPGMKVYHPARTSYAEMRRKWDRHTAHDFAQYRVRPLGRLRWLARTAAMALSPAAEWLRILRSDRISGLRSRLLAWGALTRIRLYRTRIMLRLALGLDPDALTGQWNRGG